MGLYKKVLRLASTPDFLEVFVLLSLVVELFSSTMMVRISPTLRARLSPIMDREASSRQSESAGSRIGCESLASAASAPILQSDENCLFTLHLSTQFTSRLSIAHPHHLSRQ